MRKSHDIKLEILSAIDDKILVPSTLRRSRLLARLNNGAVVLKRLLVLTSAAAIFFLVVSVAFAYMLLIDRPPTGIVKQVPIYEGMSVSEVNPAHNEEVQPLAMAASSAVQLLDAKKDDAPTDEDIFYAKQGQDFYLTVHLNNPDNFLIMSFTLNGKIYSSYMFEDGSDMENLILKCNAGEQSGILEYTIDAIKYIDGTEIKDAVLAGQRTIRIGIKSTEQPDAVFSDVKIGFGDYTFTPTLVSIQNLPSDAKMYADLYCESTLIERQEVSLTQTEAIRFSNLDENTEYRVEIVCLYDAYDGFGKKEHIRHIEYFKTQSLVTLNSVTASVDSVLVNVTSHDTNGYLKDLTVELQKDGKVLRVASGEGPHRFAELSVMGKHTIKITYIYDLMDGQGNIEKTILRDFTTQSAGLAIENGVIVGIGSCTDTDLYINMPVGDNAFRSNFQIQTVHFGPDTLSIGESAFRECNLTAVTFPDTMQFIGKSAFYKCYVLQKMNELPKGLTVLNQSTFALCTSLRSISLPKGLTSIGKWALYETEINSVFIPEGVTEICDSAFSGCNSLQSVTLPSTLTTIGKFAFQQCDKLSEIVLPSSLATIGERAFAACYALKQVYIPASVTKIEEYAFTTECTIYVSASERPQDRAINWAKDYKELIWGYSK